MPHNQNLRFALLMAILVLSSCCLVSFCSDAPMPVQSHDSAEESLKKDGIVIIEHPEDDPTGSTRLLNVPHGNAVLDNIIVGTMDGKLVCLDVLTGREMWSVVTGADMIKSSIAQLIPSLNGNIYLYNKGRLDKHPMSVYDIVAKSPFSMNDDLLYIGSKETQLYSIDPETGDCHKCTASGSHACGDFNEKGRLLVMRSDYLVKAVDRWTGEMRWNVSLGEYSTTSAVGLPMPKDHFSFPDSNFDDFGSDRDYSSQYHSSVPVVPTHGLLSAMDGSLRLIEIATSKTVWTVILPSPAVHMQNNIYTSSHLDFVLTDLKFIPQLLLHLDTTQLREGESRIFIAEHNSNLIAIEQLAQYEASDNGHGLGDGQATPQLDSKSGTIFSFPSSPETTPVALPSDRSKQEGGETPLRGGQITTIEEETTHGFSFFIPTRKCSGPHDMSLDCLLGIHYIVMDPCCVGDNCMCDATLKLPDKPTPALGDRPNQNLSNLHPNFDWDSGDYDSLLRAIIMFDWYRQQIRAWPVWMQIFLPVPFLLLVVALIRKGTRPLPPGIHSSNPNGINPIGSPGSPNSGNNALNPSAFNPLLSGVGISNGAQNPLLPGSPQASLSRSVPDSNGVVQVGKLQVMMPKVLGHGSSGTVVFEGSMNGRKVAVKRMLKTFYSIAERETHLLTQTDEHPNVIRYYTTEEDSDFIYLALSFAERTLANFIEDEECFTRLDGPQKRNLLHQLAHGMRHLHEINIVHRDIKPQNVLITGNGIVKISDMGLAKKLESDTLSLSTAAHGTVGWQAPELIIARVSDSSEDSSSRTTQSSSSSGSYVTPGSSSSNTHHGATTSDSVGSGSTAQGSSNTTTPTSPPTRIKVSKRVDIFSLGCLFYYVLTRRHPFGDRLVRESNIVSNTVDLSGISSEAADMVRKMLSPDPKMRPTAAQVLEHPYFWDPNKLLRFLKDASDFFEFEKPNSEPVLRFEMAAERAAVIPDMNWIAQLPDELLQDLNKFRKYNGAKLRDLLRVIRNKAHHYRDLPPETQQTFGPLPEGFLDYFCLHRFPDLLTFTWNYARNNYSEDKVFSEYFPHGPGHINPDPHVDMPAPTISSLAPSSSAPPSSAPSPLVGGSKPHHDSHTPSSHPIASSKPTMAKFCDEKPSSSSSPLLQNHIYDQKIGEPSKSPNGHSPPLKSSEDPELPPGIKLPITPQKSQMLPSNEPIAQNLDSRPTLSPAASDHPRTTTRPTSPVKPTHQSHPKGAHGKGGFSWGKQNGSGKSSSNASTSNNWRQKN